MFSVSGSQFIEDGIALHSYKATVDSLIPSIIAVLRKPEDADITMLFIRMLDKICASNTSDYIENFFLRNSNISVEFKLSIMCILYIFHPSFSGKAYGIVPFVREELQDKDSKLHIMPNRVPFDVMRCDEKEIQDVPVPLEFAINTQLLSKAVSATNNNLLTQKVNDFIKNNVLITLADPYRNIKEDMIEYWKLVSVDTEKGFFDVIATLVHACNIIRRDSCKKYHIMITEYYNQQQRNAHVLLMQQQQLEQRINENVDENAHNAQQNEDAQQTQQQHNTKNEQHKHSDKNNQHSEQHAHSDKNAHGDETTS